MGIGYTEALLILIVVLLLFGARKLPELARALGKSMGEFKKGKEEGLAEKTGPKPADDKCGDSCCNK